MLERERGATLLLMLALLAAAGLPGCGLSENKTCPKGQTCWKCTIQPTPCHMTYITFPCAGNEQDAIAAANRDAIFQMKLRDQEIVGTVCSDTGSPRIPSKFE